MYTGKTDIKVRYAETDKMGIVHHSNYYVYFELARGEFIKDIFKSYSEIEKEGIMIPLVESHCKYIKPAEYEDELTIETHIEKVTPVKIIFACDVIRNSDNKLLAKGRTVHPFVDDNFKITNIKKKYPLLWEKLSEAAN